MLKLICGPSGAGKTAYLTEEIRKDLQNGIRCFLLVPEQQAYISERDLPALLPKNASLLFEVVNFSGLCDDVFRAYGGFANASVDAGVRTVLMWDTLHTLRSHLLQYGKNVGNDPSFPSMMLSTVTELRQNGIDGLALERVANALEDSATLKRKLSDLSLIDAFYHHRMEECFGEDPSDRLSRLARTLQEHPYFEGCHVYVDSFTGFTAQEYPVLLEILKQADCVTVALCSDAFASKLPQFAGTVKAARQLEKYASMANVDTEKLLLPRKCGAKPAALEILERDLWRFGSKCDPEECKRARNDGSVRFVKCSNLYEEAEVAAWNVLELVQSGIPYGEIAIVARDMEAYRGVIDAALERYGIPYFLSERTDLTSKPISRLILSALRAVTYRYRSQDIITMLKTGLAGIDAKDTALFEEYCDTWHINGARFADPLWSMNPDGLTTDRSARAEEILESANRTRAHIMEPLLRLEASMKASKTVKERCCATYEYLCAIRLSEILSERAARELADSQVRKAGETLRLYSVFLESLTTLATLLPDKEISCEEFISVLSLLFTERDLGSVPATHDCVILGSASTLRVENVKASILLGLCEGEFPRAVTDTGLLTEMDKLILEDFELRFDTGMASRNEEELLHVYRAMTKPTQSLLLFTNARLPDGSERTPSFAFGRALQVLGREERDVEAVNPHAIKQRSTNAADQARPLEISPCACGTALRLSQSKIKDFVNCPYSYYSRYVLILRDKKDATPSLADDGTFLHYVYENFLRASLSEDGALRLPNDGEIEDIADGIIERYLTEIYPVSPDEMDQRLVHLFNRLRGLSLMMLRHMVAQLRESKFVPTYFEKGIGRKGTDSLPAVRIELENGSFVTLSGQIDRVDLYEKDGEIYVTVTDYKAGAHDKFSISQVRSGMDIQLVLYLFALRASDPRVRIAGAEYLFTKTSKGSTAIEHTGFALNDAEILDSLDASEEKIHLRGLLMQSEEELQELQEEMIATTKRIALRILSGEAQKTPSEKACRF